MTTLDEYRGYGDELEYRLKLKTFPIGVKLLTSEQDISDKAMRPKKDHGTHLPLCQALAMSRRDGAIVAMLKEDMWCYLPVIGLGMAEPPDYYMEGNMYYPSMVKTKEAAKKLAQDFPRLEYGKYVGIMSAPLSCINFEPDLAVVYCDSVQLLNLLTGLRYQEGHQVKSTLAPAAACVCSIVPPILTGEAQVSVPCRGDRRWAIAQDDEMIFSVPAAQLESLVDGVRYRDEAGAGLPMDFVMMPEPSLSESYIKMGKMMGMDVH